MQHVVATSLHMEALGHWRCKRNYCNILKIFNYFVFLNAKLKTRQAMANVIPRAARE